MPTRRHRTREGHRTLVRFVWDESGAILVFWGIFLAVAFGFLALSVDFGRVASTQTELQSFADQVALAAAGELDGRTDAITRATAAARSLIADTQTFAEGARAVAGAGAFTLVFRSSLPPNDMSATGSVTTDARLARFVTVQVNTRTVRTPFATVASVLNGTLSADVAVTAEATAGRSAYACDVTPLMFCVPSSSWSADANRGKQIILRAVGANAAWQPGNFGFLDPASTLPIDPKGPCAKESGAGLYRCLVGAERAVTACLRTDRLLSTLTGQRTGLAEAFNTRFDHFFGSMNSYRTNADYRPAPNTVQGTLATKNGNGPACRSNKPTNSSDTMALPRDTCLTNGRCTGTSAGERARFGDGSWDRDAYVKKNHGTTWPPGTGTSSTRYEMYLAEIAAAKLRAAPKNVPLPDRSETGAALCHASGPTTDPDRRTVIAAAVDCSSQRLNGNSTGVIPLEYVKLFMTEPVGSPGGADDAEIVVEVVRSAGGFGTGTSEGSFREIVQLYR